MEQLVERGAGCPEDDGGRAARRAAPRLAGHHGLHVRHDRPPQGLHAHPRPASCSSWPSRCKASTSSSTTSPRRLLFLPLAHVFARVVQIGAVRTRTRLGHSADVAHLVRDLQAFEPTFVLAVPRVFEKVFNTASQEAAGGRSGPLVRPCRRGRHRLEPRHRRGPPRRAAAGPPPVLRPTGLCTAAASPSVAAASTPSRAAPRSASGSATSTEASASPCSRATASRRPRPPSP